MAGDQEKIKKETRIEEHRMLSIDLKHPHAFDPEEFDEGIFWLLDRAGWEDGSNILYLQFLIVNDVMHVTRIAQGGFVDTFNERAFEKVMTSFQENKVYQAIGMMEMEKFDGGISRLITAPKNSPTQGVLSRQNSSEYLNGKFVELIKATKYNCIFVLMV